MWQLASGHTASRATVVAIVSLSCTPAPRAPIPAAATAPPVDLIAAELAAYEAARPVFERWCISCHTPDGGAGSMGLIITDAFDISHYPFGGVHGNEAGYVVAAVLGSSFTDLDEREQVSWAVRPGLASMPRTQPGAVQGDELERVLAWARAWRTAERAGKHARRQARGERDDRGRAR